MSKEREFLKKLRYASLLENDLRKELEELLAQHEQTEQQPEAWILEDKKTGYRRQSAYKPTVEAYKVIPLYTAPPKREPLSTDAMLRLIAEHRDFPLNLVRAVEKEHGIGGGE